MNNLNDVLLEGNLTADAEIKTLVSGTMLCIFGIAVNRSYKQDDEWRTEVSYFLCEAWGKIAEYAQNKLQKGRGVRITGRLKQDRWTDESGNNRQAVKIIADRLEFAPAKKQESDNFLDDIPF